MYIQKYKSFFFFSFLRVLVAVFVCTPLFECFWISSESYLYVLGFIFASHFWTLDFETNIQCFYWHVGRFIDFFVVALFFFSKKKKTKNLCMMFIWMHAFLKLTKVAERCKELVWEATMKYLLFLNFTVFKHIFLARPTTTTSKRLYSGGAT